MFRLILCTLFILLMQGASLFSQTKKEDLQRQREQLNEQIALTKKLIYESESRQKLTANQLSMLREQIRYREALLASITGEIKDIEREINDREKSVETLRTELKAMQQEYARMVISAYKNRSSYDRLMYVFAADDFNQAYKRFKMTQHYAARRKEQMIAMSAKQEELAKAIRNLQDDKKEKESLAAVKEQEKKSITRDKQNQETKLSSLRAEEKQLRDQQKKQEADRKKLTARMEEIIRA
ncbi:MAG: murein hydrolase activator EnvC family protein [Bacteroidota bacterium]